MKLSGHSDCAWLAHSATTKCDETHDQRRRAPRSAECLGDWYTVDQRTGLITRSRLLRVLSRKPGYLVRFNVQGLSSDAVPMNFRRALSAACTFISNSMRFDPLKVSVEPLSLASVTDNGCLSLGGSTTVEQWPSSPPRMFARRIVPSRLAASDWVNVKMTKSFPSAQTPFQVPTNDLKEPLPVPLLGRSCDGSSATQFSARKTRDEIRMSLFDTTLDQFVPTPAKKIPARRSMSTDSRSTAKVAKDCSAMRRPVRPPGRRQVRVSFRNLSVPQDRV